MRTGLTGKTWLSLLVLVATIVGFVLSFELLAQVVGWNSPWLGLLAMFYLLGLSKVAEPLFLARLPAGLRTVRSWEMQGPLYRRLGVLQFGQLLRGTPLRHLNNAVYLSARQPDPARIVRQAEAAEAAHLLAAVLFMPWIAHVWLGGQAAVAALFLAVNIGFNVYPILHLRLVRGRLGRVLARHPGAVWRPRGPV